jgi:hypothetical protein
MAAAAVRAIGLARTGCRVDDGVFEHLAFPHLLVDEVDQQDRVAHDDAGQRDHADHGCRGELRAQQGMAGHDRR